MSSSTRIVGALTAFPEVDPDRVETHNLDRLLYASESDVGEYKVDLVGRNLERGTTAERFHIETHARPIEQETGYRAVLDCDVLFSAVDRPLPKDLLNRIAYAHCIPVISGRLHVDNKPSGELANVLWSVTVVGPDRRCLCCDGQYTSSDVVLERGRLSGRPRLCPASEWRRPAGEPERVSLQRKPGQPDGDRDDPPHGSRSLVAGPWG